MFNNRKAATPSPLPLAEQQRFNATDDSDVSVYNSKSSTPTLTTDFDNSSVSITDREVSESDSTQSSLKRIHKHSKSTLPYSVTDESSFSKSSPSSSTSSKHSKSSSTSTAFRTPTGLNSALNLIKQTITESGNLSFAIVIALLIFLIVFTDPSWSPLFGSKIRPIQGLTKETISINSPFIVPDLNKFWQEKPGSALGGGNNGPDVPKKAPGDYAKAIGDEKAPHAAKGAGNANPEKIDISEKTDKTGKNGLTDENDKTGGKSGKSSSALDAKKKKQDLNAMVYKHSATTPDLIMVLAINPERYKLEYIEKLIKNRRIYAERYNYGLYIRYITDFNDEWSTSFGNKPSWAKLSVMRAAFHAFPNAKHFWYLDHNALISNMDINVVDQIIAPPSLKSIMLKDVSITVQEPSVIHTYRNSNPEKIKFIVTQDHIGLNPTSFIFSNYDSDKGDFAKSMLDYWNDPLSRSYKSFEHAESSALNHILQWHPVFLSRSAVISTRRMAAFSVAPPQGASLKKQLTYVPGDFVVIVSSCLESSSLACMKEFSDFTGQAK